MIFRWTVPFHLAALLSATVHAQTAPCRPRGEFLDVAMPGTWDPGERGALFAELNAALAVRDLELCVEGNGSSRALVVVRFEPLEATIVRISVVDRVTEKFVRRDIDVSAFEPSTRNLALAIAADELVRASWAELVLEDSPTPREAAPPVVRRAVRDTVDDEVVEAPPDRWLDLSTHVDGYTGGEVHFGGALSLERWLHPHAGLRIGGGGSAGVRQRGQLGSVASRSVRGHFEMLGRIGAPDARLGLALFGGAQLGWLRFVSSAGEAARADDRSSMIVNLRAGASLRLRFSRIRLLLDLGAGIPVLSALAQDGPRDLSGTSGVLFFASLGVGVRL